MAAPLVDSVFTPDTMMRKTSILLLSVTITFMAVSAVMGQTEGRPRPADVRSQRWLPLPEQRRDQPSSADWSSLYEKFKGHVEARNREASESGRPPIDLEQIEKLKNLFKEVGDQLPEGVKLPDVDQIPDEILSKAMNSPEFQRQAESLLKRFAKDGRFPKWSSNSKSDGNLPLPSDVGSPNQDTESQEAASQGARNGDATDRSKRNEPPIGQDLNASEMPADSRSESRSNPKTKFQSTPKSDEQPLSDSRRSQAIDRDPPLPANPKKDGGQPDSRRSDSGRSISDARKSTDGLGLRPNRRNGEITKSDMETNDVDSSRLRKDDGRSSDPNHGLSSVDMKSLEGLMEELQKIERESNSQSTQPSSNLGRNESNSYRPSNEKLGGLPRAEDRSRSQPNSELAKSIQEELKREGFGKAIQRIVEQSKQEAQQNRRDREIAKANLTAENQPSADRQRPSTSGKSSEPASKEPSAKGPWNLPDDERLTQSLVKTLEGLGKDAAEIAKDAQFIDSKRNASSASTNSKSSALSRTAKSAESAFKKANESASGFFKSVARAPAGSSTNPSMGPSGWSSLPSLSGEWNARGLLWGIALAAGTAGLIWFFRKNGLLASNERAAEAEWKSLVEQSDSIRTRQDVIRAFHRLSGHVAKAVEPWWTHRRVERTSGKELPSIQSAMRILADVYEEARYLPDHVELSPARLSAMREALKQCTV